MATGGDSGGAEGAVPMPGCSDWTAVTGTRKERRQIDRSANKQAHIVYMTGIEKDVAKMNPLELRKKIMAKIWSVERVYISGDSLKIYCSTNDQKLVLLCATQLDDIEIQCSEPKVGFGKNLDGAGSPPKTSRWVITGVSLDVNKEEVCEETRAK